MTTVPDEPRCPFCYRKIDPPRELQERKIMEFPIGACGECGSVYAYDATGHNMGAAFIEALLFACNDDSDLAFSLSSGEDYSDAMVGNYDIETHSIVTEKVYNERYVRGAVIFVRLADPFRTGEARGVREKLKITIPIEKGRLRSEKFSREIVRAYVKENRRDELKSLAIEDSRVLKELQKMLYTPDEVLRWRVIDILGEVCAAVAERRPDLVSKLATNLLQNAASPGSSAWGSLETVGAIIAGDPYRFADFCPTLLAFFSHENLWREVAWAVGAISAVRADLVKGVLPRLLSLLENPEPFLRACAAWGLGNMRNTQAADTLRALEKDNSPVVLFRNGRFEELTVSQLSSEALAKIE